MVPMIGDEKTAVQKFGILGVPWDTGASLGRPGARYAPTKVRESLGWILNRIQDQRIAAIEKQKIVDLHDICIKDFGDVELIHDDYQGSFENMSAKVRGLLVKGYIPLIIGGDHSISFPFIRELQAQCEGNVGLIQFDAHLDLLDESPTQGKFSQSSEIRRALELDRVLSANVVQVGVRGYNFPSNWDFVCSENIQQITPQQIRHSRLEEIAEKCLEIAGNGTEKIYVTLDIDVLDTVYAPGCGANEPGGMHIDELEILLDLIAPQVDCLDVVEVNPLFDLNDMTSSVASKLLMNFIISKTLAL